MAKLKAPFALDRSLNTTEQTPRSIADVLAEELSAIITALGGLNFINYEVVEELPTTGISTTTIYLVPSDDPQSGNTYDEYINLNGTVSGWEKIGSTDIDLSGYYTSAETDALLDEKVDKDSFDEQTATDTFETINGGLLSSLKVSLTPNQDLHGYDSPWVGGASDNLLPMTVDGIKALNTDGTWNGNVYTWRGIEYTILTDDGNNVIGINSNGTATERGWLFLAEKHFDDNDVTFGGSVYASTANYSYYCGFTNQDAYIYYNSSSNKSYILIANGYTTNNQKWHPIVRTKTTDAPSFSPYTNICPISGHTQVEVGDDGKNRYDATAKTSGVYLTTDGATSGSGASDATDYIPIDGSVTLSYKYDNLNSSNTRIICFYDENKQFTEYSQYTPTDANKYKKITFTPTDPDSVYVRFTLDKGAYDVQVELGSTATDYVPYNGYQVTVNLGGTYYSGVLDVVTGLFTPDTAKYVLTDISVLEAYTTDTSYGSLARIKTTEYPSIKEDMSLELASFCKAVANEDRLVDLHDNRCFVNNNAILIRASVDENVTTVNELFAIFENCEFVMPLANPTPIQLIPTPVKANVGENHLSAPLDGQEITESKYKKMFTFDDVIAYIQSL